MAKIPIATTGAISRILFDSAATTLDRETLDRETRGLETLVLAVPELGLVDLAEVWDRRGPTVPRPLLVLEALLLDDFVPIADRRRLVDVALVVPARAEPDRFEATCELLDLFDDIFFFDVIGARRGAFGISGWVFGMFG